MRRRRRTSRRRWRIGGWVVALSVLVMPATAHADPSGSLVSVRTHGQQLDVVMSAQGIPTGVSFDPASVVVQVDGAAVPSSATVASPAPTSSTAPTRRVAMIVVDTSGSMAGTPLAEVKQAAAAFLNEVPPDVAVGLVSFADSAHLLVAPTVNRQVVRAQLQALKAAGNTTLYDALQLAVAQLGTNGQRLLLVLSDGADTSSRASLAAATAVIRASHVSTELVGFRTDPKQTATLNQLATDVGGRLVPASDVNTLVSAYAAAAVSFATQVHITATLPDGLATGLHDVSVSMSFGGQTVSDSATFTRAAPPAPPAASAAPAADASAVSTLQRPLVLVPLTVFVFVVLLLLLLAVLVPRGRVDTRKNLRSLDAYGGAGAAAVARQGVGEAPDAQTGIAQTALGVSDRFVEKRGTREALALRLERADIRLTAGEWVLLRTCAGVATTLVASLLLDNVWLGLVVGIALTAIVSRTILSHRARKRVNAFQDSLPDTLQLVASSIRTGFSLPQAVDAAAQGAVQPMSGELNRAIAEARLGTPLEDGLDRVADRMDSQDLHWTVMAVRIQREVGGNLSEVLNTTATTMRDRASMRRRVRALSAEGRLSAYILIALPLLLGFFMFLTRRQYLSLLWTSTPGLIMSGLAVTGFVVGWLWMRKLVDVEV